VGDQQKPANADTHTFPIPIEEIDNPLVGPNTREESQAGTTNLSSNSSPLIKRTSARISLIAHILPPPAYHLSSLLRGPLMRALRLFTATYHRAVHRYLPRLTLGITKRNVMVCALSKLWDEAPRRHDRQLAAPLLRSRRAGTVFKLSLLEFIPIKPSASRE
jgi:hypothetical protein